MSRAKYWMLTALGFIVFLVSACGDDDYYPKPRGYFRIETPEKQYVAMDSNLAYAFEYPVYARLEQDPVTERNHNWLNLSFPQFKGTVHLSYKPVNDNLAVYIEDSHEFVNKHIPKANSIKTRTYVNDSAKVYGLVYEIKGAGAATPLQFYLTDSTKHFIRGVLYFKAKPNNDSLAPVIDFVEQDINHLIETFRWQNE